MRRGDMAFVETIGGRGRAMGMGRRFADFRG